MNIEFFYEETDFVLDQPSNIQWWISEVVRAEQYTIESLNYIFCSDEYLLEMNKEYLNHDTYTDIITFDNSDEEYSIEADIFISIDRVEENCQLHNTEFDDELARVIVHGVLHIMGWSDKTEALKKQMREKEDACLSLR